MSKMTCDTFFKADMLLLILAENCCELERLELIKRFMLAASGVYIEERHQKFPCSLALLYQCVHKHNTHTRIHNRVVEKCNIFAVV